MSDSEELNLLGKAMGYLVKAMESSKIESFKDLNGDPLQAEVAKIIEDGIRENIRKYKDLHEYITSNANDPYMINKLRTRLSQQQLLVNSSIDYYLSYLQDTKRMIQSKFTYSFSIPALDKEIESLEKVKERFWRDVSKTGEAVKTTTNHPAGLG
jgi:endonuclease III-like uncharacterized protein